MRDPKERLLDMLDAIERIEKYGSKGRTASCPDPPFILRDPQDERFFPIMVSLSNHTLTFRRDLYFLSNAPCPEGTLET
jgi:hypothetical protein